MPGRAPIRLRSPGDSALTVDRERGVISGAAIITVGPAIGHGFEVDRTMLDQARRHLAARAVPVGFTHSLGDSLASRVGSLRNPRIDGAVLRADVHLGGYSRSTPAGNLRDYLLGLADEAPESFGLSLVFAPADFERASGKTLGRIAAVQGVDFVGEPAANPRGLLSTPSNSKEAPMNKKLREALAAKGLVALEATDEEAVAFVKKMIADCQGIGEGGDAGEGEGEGADPAMSRAVNAGVNLERKRAAHARGVARQFRLGDAWAQQQISGGFTIEQIGANAIETLAKLSEGARTYPPRVTMTREPADGARAGLVDAIAMKRGCKVDSPAARAREFVHLRPLEQVRHLFQCLGVETSGVSRADLAKAACNRRAFEQLSGGMVTHTSSDYPSILADSIGKTLRGAYLARPASWRGWAQQRLVADFKEQSRVSLSDFPALEAVAEGGEIKHATIGESKEVFTLATFAAMFTITWQSLVNDDLNAFAGVEQRMVLSAIALEDTLAYQPLTADQTMTEDGLTLFNVAHNNTVSGTPSGAPSVAQLSAMRALMARQTGPGGNILSLRPSSIVVPSELATVAEQLVASLVDPSKSNNTTNPAWIRNLAVVDDARLSVDSATKWYLVSNDIDNVVVAFLEDEPMPVVETDESFDTFGTRIRIRHSCAARAIEYRAFVRNG